MNIILAIDVINSPDTPIIEHKEDTFSFFQFIIFLIITIIIILLIINNFYKKKLLEEKSINQKLNLLENEIIQIRGNNNEYNISNNK